MTNDVPDSAATVRRRVFFVDDHPLVREWLASLVGLEPDLVVCGQSEDAAAALASAPLANPEIMLVDLSLPHGSGLELIRDMRAQHPAVKLLVLSMHDEPSVAERALRAGAAGYASKRDSGPEIIAAIRQVLAGKLYASPTLAGQVVTRLKGAPPETLLSERELAVFRLRGEGRGGREIAEILGLSAKTVGSYEARIKEKLGLADASELMREAVIWHERQPRS